MIRALGLWIATVGGVGYAPVAPGTAGSIAGLVVLLAVRRLLPGYEVPLLAGVIGVGVWAAAVAADVVADDDPGIVVIDEVAGMLLTLLWVPLTPWAALIGFTAFRVFDIVKPFPAAAAERLPGGMGIMADDLVAGLYAAVVVRLCVWLLPGTGGT